LLEENHGLRKKNPIKINWLAVFCTMLMGRQLYFARLVLLRALMRNLLITCWYRWDGLQLY